MRDLVEAEAQAILAESPLTSEAAVRQQQTVMQQHQPAPIQHQVVAMQQQPVPAQTLTKFCLIVGLFLMRQLSFVVVVVVVVPLQCNQKRQISITPMSTCK